MNFVRLEQPSRTILVAIVVPSGTVITEPAAAIPGTRRCEGTGGRAAAAGMSEVPLVPGPIYGLRTWRGPGRRATNA